MENMGEKLINRLQRNERAAYMELYDFYFKRLHHFAVNFVFDYDVANDIVQSVFIKLYESISGFSADVNIGAYLCNGEESLPQLSPGPEYRRQA